MRTRNSPVHAADAVLSVPAFSRLAGNALAVAGRSCDGWAMKPARLAALVVGGVLLFAALTVAAQTRTNSPVQPPVVSFDTFKSIPDRNVFNSRRSSGRTEVAAPRRDPVIESFSLLGTLDYPKGSVAFFEGTSSSHRRAVRVDESIGGCKITHIEQNLVRLEANGKPVELKVGYMLRREDEGAWTMRESERPADFSPGYTPTGGGSSGFGSSSSSGSSSSRDSRYGSSRDSRYGSSRDSRSVRESRTSSSSTPTGSSSTGSSTASSPSGTGGSSSAPAATSSSGGSESDILKRLMQQREQENKR